MIADDSWLLNKPVAHRGLHNDIYPENSMGAFEYAVKCGFPIEMDVHLTCDGHLIVFHDNDLLRVTGDRRMTESVTLAEATQLKILGSKYTVPCFKEFLELIGGKVPLLIEIKNPGKVGALEQRLIDDLRGYKGELAVQSFNPMSIAYLKNNAPGHTRGLLCCTFKGEKLAFFKKFVLKHQFLLKKSGAEFINYKWSELPRNTVTKTGLPILGWTVRSREEHERARLVTRNVVFENFIPQ